MNFGDGSGHIPRQAKVEGERRSSAPVILDEGPVDLPAPAGDGTAVRLVVDGAPGHAQQQIGLRTAGHDPGAAKVSEGTHEPEAVLKFFGADVHLIVTEIEAGADLMLSADQVKNILEGIDVRSALKRRVAAIAERPIAAGHIGGNQTLTVGTSGDRRTAGRASQIGAGNSQLRRAAAKVSQ